MLYRILTEDKNRADVERIVSAWFDGFTVYPATGYWKSTQEKSLVVEIETDKASTVHLVASLIKSANKQESVLVQALESASTFV